MKKDYTEIALVLDRSGSMDMVKNDTVGSFNTFIEDQKKVPGKVAFTLVQFDDVYEIVHDGKDLQDIPALTSLTYTPRGSTALYDAIGTTLNKLGARIANMQENDRPEKVVFVILTDGEENSSKEFNASNVSEMITHQREKYKWEFIFLGANQDAIISAKTLGINAANAMSYSSTGVGTQAAVEDMSSNVRGYRTGATMDAAFSVSQQQNQNNLINKHGK